MPTSITNVTRTALPDLPHIANEFDDDLRIHIGRSRLRPIPPRRLGRLGLGGGVPVCKRVPNGTLDQSAPTLVSPRWFLGHPEEALRGCGHRDLAESGPDELTLTLLKSSTFASGSLVGKVCSHPPCVPSI